MKLYLYQRQLNRKSKQRADTTDALIRHCLQMYYKEEGILPREETSIIRQKNGKPVFAEGDVHFSVSHSGNLWTCLMGRTPVGLDIQQRKKTNWEGISNRFFTTEEREYVEAKGELGFWQIWVLKEAYVKYLGTTLGHGMKNYSMIERGRPVNQMKGAWLNLCMLSDDVYCAYVGEKREKICKKKWI